MRLLARRPQAAAAKGRETSILLHLVSILMLTIALALAPLPAKTPADELLAMMREPGMDDYRPQSQGTLRLARHMYRPGTLKTLPQAWTDYFFPISAGLEGS
jgi:hypothetical protein